MISIKLPKLYSYNMGTVCDFLYTALLFIQRKLPQPILYSYNLGSYWIQSLNGEIERGFIWGNIKL